MRGVEGFDLLQEGRFARVVQAEEEEGVFFLACGVQVEGFEEVVHCCAGEGYGG